MSPTVTAHPQEGLGHGALGYTDPANVRAAACAAMAIAHLAIGPARAAQRELQLSEETGIAESTIQKILKLFQNEQQIEQQTNNKFSLITIKN